MKPAPPVIRICITKLNHVAGRAGSGFPTTPGSLQPSFGGDITPNGAYGQQDGFVTKVAPDGSRIIWSTYFGGAGRDFIRDIALDSGGGVFVAVSEVDQNHPHITASAFQRVRKGAQDEKQPEGFPRAAFLQKRKDQYMTAYRYLNTV